MRSTRALAWFAIAAQVAFVAAWVVGGALEDGYSHVDHYVSELGSDGAANPNLMNAAIVVLGLSLIAIAGALSRALPPGRARRIPVALFVLAGVAVTVGGFFNTECSTAVDPTCQDRWDAGDVDTSSWIHGWAGLAGQVFLFPTPFALAAALWNRPAAAPALASGVVGVVVAVLTTVALGVDHGPDGLTQRVGLASIHLWVIIIATGVLWATRPRPNVPATPMRPSEFFSTAWEGEAELVPWPYFLWRLWPQRLRVRREATFLSDEAWYVDDTVWTDAGERIYDRRIFCTLEAPDRVRVTADWLLDGTEILLEDDGYRIMPYRVAVPVGPIHFGVGVRDTATVCDGTLVNRLRITWFGLPVARVEARARPIARNA